MLEKISQEGGGVQVFQIPTWRATQMPWRQALQPGGYKKAASGVPPLLREPDH